jgi:hypothetical protein
MPTKPLDPSPVTAPIEPRMATATAGATDVPGAAAVLHGVTLEAIVTALVAHHGWEELARRIEIACFRNAPSVKSSLTFLRRTPWARQKVEQLYLQSCGGC